MKAARATCVTCSGPIVGRDFGFKCLDCLKPSPGTHYTPVRQCWGCGRMHAEVQSARCKECRYVHSGPGQKAQRRALAVVRALVIAGIIPKANTLTCVDCGDPAREYDHRDYDKPADVQPVCKRCNALRGYTPQTRPKFGPHAT